MSKLAIYNDLKTQLEAITGIKHVALWNNQIERENVENPFLYPAVFIQFTPNNFKDLLKGVQQYDLIVTLHICFESYADEDTSILTLCDAVYASTHKTPQTSTSSVLYRIDERQNFDHNNVQVYEQDYKTTIKDFGVDSRATTSATVTINTNTITV